MDNNKLFELPFACQQQFINTTGFKATLTKMYKGNVQQIHLYVAICTEICNDIYTSWTVDEVI